MPPCSGVLSLFLLLLTAFQSIAPDLLITTRLHHLRSGGQREWAEFPARAEGSELVVTFDSTRNPAERTLQLRHRDLKQSWRVLVNGTEIAQLPIDESDMITDWAVPAGTLRDGANELRVRCTGKASDDVLVGEVKLIDRPREQVLSEATLDLSVVEDPGAALAPVRITIVNEDGTLMPLGSVSNERQAVRPGIVYSSGGPVRLTMPAGRYVIYAGRGFEYSVARITVDLARGVNPARRLAIRREVKTRGWAAMDTHIHTGTFAKHGDAAIEERMLTIAGEGLELPVSAEHNVRIDFDRYARAAGVRDRFTPILGSEVTTPALGHFNVFPIPPDAATIDAGAPGWAPLRESVRRSAGDPVIVLNHAEDLHGGFRPFGRARHISVAGEDLDGWRVPANAMEVVNSGAIMTDPLGLPRDWMGMLNRGVLLTPVGASDSHDVSRYINGQARTYVQADDRDPGRIDVERAIESVRRGRVSVSYGLLTEIDVHGRGPGEVVQPANTLDVHIRVKSPSWSRADHLAVYVNGVPVREEPIEDRGTGGLEWDATWRLPTPSHDVHVVAIATGPGISGPFWPTAKPYQPTSIEFTPHVLGVSGAVFVDADRSGSFESAFEYARREVAAGIDPRPLMARLGKYDAAVAAQAASLLRGRAPARFEDTLRAMIANAPVQVARGFAAYLQGWKESGADGRFVRPTP